MTFNRKFVVVALLLGAGLCGAQTRDVLSGDWTWTRAVKGVDRLFTYTLDYCDRDIVDGGKRPSITCVASVKYPGYKPPVHKFLQKDTWVFDGQGHKHLTLWSAVTILKKVMNTGPSSGSTVAFAPNSTAVLYMGLEYPLDGGDTIKTLVFDGMVLKNIELRVK